MPTKIPYLDETWNFLGGCSPAGKGCLHCWACRQAAGHWLKNHPLYKGLTEDGKWTGKIRLCTDIGRADMLEKPLHWREPRRIGVQFMGDLFHPKVPFKFIAEVYKVAAFTERHTYQFLTKRIDRASEFFKWLENKHTYDGGALMFKGENGKGWQYKPWPLPNVHLGVSVSTQKEADEKIPILLQIPAAVRFVSLEPLLGEIDLNLCNEIDLIRPDVDDPTHREDSPVGCLECRTGKHWQYLSEEKNCGIDQVIIGAESKGSHPGRHCKLDWVKNLIDQCDGPVFVKQLHINGKLSKKMEEWPAWAQRQEPPSVE